MVLKFLRNLAIGILALILITAITYAGTVYTINKTILNPRFYHDELTKYNGYSLLEDLAFDSLLSSMSKSQLSDSQAAQLKAKLKQVFPESFVQQSFDYITVSLLDYLNSKSDTLELGVELKDRKPILVDMLVDAALLLDPESIDPYMTRDVIKAQVESNVPDSIDIIEMAPGLESQLSDVRDKITEMNKWFIISIIIIIASVALIFLISWNLKTFCKIIGTNSLIAGITFVIPAFILPNLPLQLPPEIESVVSGLILDALHPMTTLGIVLMIAGIVFIVLSFFVPVWFSSRKDHEIHNENRYAKEYTSEEPHHKQKHHPRHHAHKHKHR